jgi:hypothetical protein
LLDTRLLRAASWLGTLWKIWRAVGCDELCKEHFAGNGLERTCDFDCYRLAHMDTAVVNDDHRAVIHVPDCLVALLPWLLQRDDSLLAGKTDDAKRMRDLVDVQHDDTLDASGLVEIVIGRTEPGIRCLG